MKIIIKYTLFLTIIITLSSCGASKAAYFPTSEVTYNSYEGEILNLRVLGYGLNEQDAIQDAQMRAFETLFFRGIPNSSINKPLIGYNETSLKNNNKRYFDDFYGYKRFLTFVSETSFISAQNQKVIGSKIKRDKIKEDMVDAVVAAVDVFINVKPLRKDLEENKVIRKFGY